MTGEMYFALVTTPLASIIDETKTSLAAFWLEDVSIGKFPREGGTPRNIGWGCAARFPIYDPIYDQNLRYSLPYLWPEQKLETLFMTRTLYQNPGSDLRYN